MAKNVVGGTISQVDFRMLEEDQTWVGLLTIHLKMTCNLPGQEKKKKKLLKQACVGKPSGGWRWPIYFRDDHSMSQACGS